MSLRRNPNEPISNLEIGWLIEIDGTHVVAELSPEVTELTRVYHGVIYPIGQFGSIVKIHFGARIIYGYVGRLRMKSDFERERGLIADPNSMARVVEADLFGEGEWRHDADIDEWILAFQRGVSTFPLPQQKVYLTPHSELSYIYGKGAGPSLLLGEHVGSGGTPCYAEMNELLGKHTAVLGSTGSGKSGTVTAILHGILERGDKFKYEKWYPNIVLLDPHNEYGQAFPDHRRLSTDEGTLRLPYWLLDLDETISLLIGKTEFAATSQTNILKNALSDARREGAKQIGIDPDEITVDSPIPYELGDPSGLNVFGERDGGQETNGLVGHINSQRPDNRNKSKHEDYSKIIRKLETLMRDSRLDFMMNPWDGENDEFLDLMGQFLSPDDRLRIVDLSGIPNEVAGAASAAIARILFSFKVWQRSEERDASPILLVCEEAHRYVPNRGEAQYAAAQEAMRRLAREGRKYGIGLLLVSQRPAEVEATVLSQCNSWIVLRTSNESDRSHVAGILPDALAGLSKVLSGLRQREAIFVGQAALLPTRILVRDLVQEQKPLPRSHDIDFDLGWQAIPISAQLISDIGRRWRTQTRKP